MANKVIPFNVMFCSLRLVRTIAAMILMPSAWSFSIVAISDTPVEVTEVWTFARQRGGNWEVSAIQQSS